MCYVLSDEQKTVESGQEEWYRHCLWIWNQWVAVPFFSSADSLLVLCYVVFIYKNLVQAFLHIILWSLRLFFFFFFLFFLFFFLAFFFFFFFFFFFSFFFLFPPLDLGNIEVECSAISQGERYVFDDLKVRLVWHRQED